MKIYFLLNAIIIDPIRDIDGYNKLINKNNSELKFILETHFHADFISGHIELSNKYNVPIIFGPHADTNFNSINKEDGEIIKLGEVSLFFDSLKKVSGKNLRILIDECKKDYKKSIICLISSEEKKITIAIGVTNLSLIHI